MSSKRFTEDDLLKRGLRKDGTGNFVPISKTPKQPKQVTARGRVRGMVRRRGQMNKTESAYADHLNALQRAGKILWWQYEAITLKLATDTRWTPDFIIQMADGEIVLHEAKGHIKIFQEASKVRVKVCAELFPFRVFIVLPRPQKMGGGWDITEVKSDQ